MSLRRNIRSTTKVEPTGTVDLFTTIASCSRTPEISVTASSSIEVSADPSSSWGVGTQRRRIPLTAPASAAPNTKERRPEASTLPSISSRPSSTMVGRPAESILILAASMSPARTVWPRCARHTAVVRPT